MAIQESGENYLETLLLLKENQTIVHSIDIARKMNFSKPSVSKAIKKLKNDGYILIDEHGNIDFTVKGYNIAKTIYERHVFFTEFLLNLGIEKSVAEADACRIEHVLSDETFKAIKSFVIKTRSKNCK